jgi:predicted transcriptional regulator
MTIYSLPPSLIPMKNRSRPDIIAIILEAANGGITKTRLLTKANLTSGQLRQYLDVLMDKKLVIELADEDKRHVAYRTTERGMRYLAAYAALKNIAVFPQED